MSRVVLQGLMSTAIVGLLASQSLSVITPRSIDGSGNNVANPTWGTADTQLLRVVPNAYDDGISDPRGGFSSSLPSPRAISNAVHDQAGVSMPSKRNLTNWVFQWGQFLDHDIDLTPGASPAEPFNIPVPADDPDFDPFNTGTQVIGLNRSIHDTSTGTDTSNPRQQINQITSFIDGSNVYGSDAQRAMNLRAGVGGRLLTQTGPDGDLLPFNSAGFIGGFEENANDLGADPSTLFVAGDVRANEQVGLTATHTLFVREHNRLADIIASIDGGLSDEDIYQKARKIVGAQMQVVTYREFLPALMGPVAPELSSLTYDPSANASIANLFSTAGFRIGHTMLPPVLERLDANGDPISQGNLSLAQAFFNPDEVSNIGLDPYLRGLGKTTQQEIDRFIVDGVRNFLFGPPGAGGLDLASLNIQRGRDHGLPSYNDVRAALGLSPATTFADITSDTDLQAALASVYSSIDDVDVWTGGLSEDHIPNASLGRLFGLILQNQFTALAEGDRFFYLFDPDLDPQTGHPVLLQAIQDAYGTADIDDVRLSHIIRANSNAHVQRNVFSNAVPEPASATVLLLGVFGATMRRRRTR